MSLCMSMATCVQALVHIPCTYHAHAMHTWWPQVLLLVKPGLQSQTVAHPKLLGLLKQLKPSP